MKSLTTTQQHIFFGFGKVCYPWGKPEQLKLVKAKQHVADY